jgi:hypothetical protein
MSKHPRRAPNYDRKLARRITLEDGTKLTTLRDAANLFAERFATALDPVAKCRRGHAKPAGGGVDRTPFVIA